MNTLPGLFEPLLTDLHSLSVPLCESSVSLWLTFPSDEFTTEAQSSTETHRGNSRPKVHPILQSRDIQFKMHGFQGGLIDYY